jgi:hypothetical protein
MGDIAGRPRFDENGLRIPFFRGPHLVNQADTPYEPPLPAPGDKPPSMWDDASAAASSIGSYMPFGIDGGPRGQGELSHFVLPPRVQTRRWYAGGGGEGSAASGAGRERASGAGAGERSAARTLLFSPPRA